MVLAQFEEDWDPESASRGGAEHLGQHAIGVIGGYQLQAGSSAQEFGKFLKTLEAAG